MEFPIANNAIKISALTACTNPQSTDLLVLVSNTAGNATSLSITANNLLGNTAANVTSNVVSATTLVITGNSTPANNIDNDSRATGSIWADGTYIYYWNGTVISKATLAVF